MKSRPRLIQGITAAAILAVSAAALVAVLASFLGLATIIRLCTPLIALAYLLYLLRSTRARTGRVVTLSAWSVMALAAWWFVPSLAFYLLLHAGAIWLVRSLYAYSSLMTALADLVMSASAAVIFTWAFMRTGSVFLATWSFFLVQAFWIYIPAHLRGRLSGKPTDTDDGKFDRARRQADAALHQLFSQKG
jgi:hypothetical protein